MVDWAGLVEDFEPVMALAGSIVIAVIGGLFALRRQIQAKAWEVVYTQKKQEIEKFVLLLSDFGHRVWILGEVRDTAKDLWARQGRSLDYWAGQMWAGEPDGFANQMFKTMFSQLPNPGKPEDLLAPPPPEVEGAFDRLRMLVTNLILEDLTRIHFALSSTQTTLQLSARNPNPLQRAVADVNTYFAQLTNPNIGVAKFDFESFPDEYAEKIGPVRLALRRDLRLSARSLRAVHAASPVWMLSRILQDPRSFIRNRWKVYVAPHPYYKRAAPAPTSPTVASTWNAILILTTFSIVFGLIIHLVWQTRPSPIRGLITPAFEEPLKLVLVLFGLIVLRAIREKRGIRGETWRPSLVACTAAGMLFAFTEHYTSYPSETAISAVLRFLSHTAYLVVGLAVSFRFRVGAPAILAWLLAASCLHLVNNVFAAAGLFGARVWFVLLLVGLSTASLSWAVLNQKANPTV